MEPADREHYLIGHVLVSTRGSRRNMAYSCSQSTLPTSNTIRMRMTPVTNMVEYDATRRYSQGDGLRNIRPSTSLVGSRLCRRQMRAHSTTERLRSRRLEACREHTGTERSVLLTLGFKARVRIYTKETRSPVINLRRGRSRPRFAPRYSALQVSPGCHPQALRLLRRSRQAPSPVFRARPSHRSFHRPLPHPPHQVLHSSRPQFGLVAGERRLVRR